MANDANFVKEMLTTLEKRVVSITSSIMECNKLGLVPSKSSIIRLQWYTILIHAYKAFNFENFYTEQQKNRINNLFRQVSEL